MWLPPDYCHIDAIAKKNIKVEKKYSLDAVYKTQAVFPPKIGKTCDCCLLSKTATIGS